mgnify:CR=1 FL=1
MSQKLPHDVKLKWVEVINQRKAEKKDYPLFPDFVNFVQMQADTYMNPIMKRNGGSGKYNLNNDNRSHKQNYSRSYNTSTNNTQGKKRPYCHLCKNNEHSTLNCNEFSSKTCREKLDFLNSNRLCFRCAKHRGFAKDCRSKMICEICGKQHATALHNPEYKSNTANAPQSSTTEIGTTLTDK